MGVLENDTICALATAPGTAGLAVFRISGPAAFPLCDSLLRQKRPCAAYAGHTLHRGYVHDGGQTIDDVLVSVFHAPRSYTGEDVVEVSCHGGIVPMRRILALLLEHGARLAEPGEFTLRAYLNGRMDLAQAEAVCDVVTARTDEAHRQAQEQQQGRLSQEIDRQREALLGIMALVEASIDFPEDVGELDTQSCRRSLSEVQAALDHLLLTAERGILYREGCSVVLAGAPNAGKSSLMNALLRTTRAIVTPVPGTTRDVIEETLNVRGVPVRLSDTAGLRQTSDLVEQIGVERTRGSVRRAHLVLIVLDATTCVPGEGQALAASLGVTRWKEVWNKMDLAPAPEGALAVSAITGQGLDRLEEAIYEAVGGGETADDRPVLTHARHRRAVAAAKEHVGHALATIEADLPSDLLSIDVRGALTALGEVTGQTATDDLINEIFSRFCIGK